MESTMPNANFQPQMVQYTPAESSMLKSVPPFVKPSSSNLAFVRTNRSANLNLKRRAPSAPTPAASLPHLALCPAVAGVASKERPKAAIRAATTWYWVASVGNRSSAWRQAANAALGSPPCAARSAVAAKRLSSSACTRRWQDGQASRAGAMCVPHCAHGDGARLGTAASVIDDGLRRRGAGSGRVWPRDLECDAPVELPRFVQREPGNQQVERTRDADHDRSRVRECDDQRQTEGDHEGPRPWRRPRRRVGGGVDPGWGRGGRGRLRAPLVLQVAGDQ